MQSDAMDVDYSSRGRRSFGSGRVSTARPSTNSGGRSPYQRPTSPTPKGNINARWGHDLFADSSDIYNPRLNIRSSTQPPTAFFNNNNNDNEFEPRPSLRPFGSIAHSTMVYGVERAPEHVMKDSGTPQLPQPPAQQQQQPAVIGRPLAERLSIKGTALTSMNRTNPTPAPIPIAAPRQSQQQQQQQQSQQRERLRPNVVRVSPSGLATYSPSPSEIRDQKAIQAKAQTEYVKALKGWELSPATLEVERLADGTSVDDVRTAFSEHGTILACEVAQGPIFQGQATLNAFITYSNRTSASRARDQFDGVVADGLQLVAKLKIKPKPKLETFIKAEEERLHAMEIEATPVAPAPVPQLPQPSKMRADLIPMDPRNSPQYTQLVAPPLAAEPIQRPIASTALPIAARISGATNTSSVPVRPGSGQGVGNQSLKDRLGSNSRQNASGSLLSRLR